MKHTLMAVFLAAIFIFMTAGTLGVDATQQTTYEREYTGTSVNAANDTLTLPATFTSIWQYNVTVDAVSPADTSTSIIAVLQENNTRTGANWYETERDTITVGSGAGTGAVRLHGLGIGESIKGVRQRLILDGQGTQKGYWTANFVLKKAN